MSVSVMMSHCVNLSEQVWEWGDATATLFDTDGTPIAVRPSPSPLSLEALRLLSKRSLIVFSNCV